MNNLLPLLPSLLDNSVVVLANVPLYVGAWYLYSLARRVVAVVEAVEACPVCQDKTRENPNPE